jgi:ABC-2 type transport system ATP-binding protein
MAQLSIRDVSQRFGAVVALDQVSLELGAGINVLLGHNGAGKTTLTEIVAGLRRPDAGSIVVNGVDAYLDPDVARRLVGWAPQQLAIYPTLTVRENLVVFAELAGLHRRLARQRIDDVLARLGIADLADRVAGLLSGGQQRCVHTAVALVHEPQILLLDEPTTGVDVEHRLELLAAVRNLAAQGVCVCYTTHYLAEVEALDPVMIAILERGRVLRAGAAADLVALGESVVELTFDGPAPCLSITGAAVEVDGQRLVLTAPAPQVLLPAVIGGLPADAAQLVSVEIRKPSLESTYLQVVGAAREAADHREVFDVRP